MTLVDRCQFYMAHEEHAWTALDLRTLEALRRCEITSGRLSRRRFNLLERTKMLLEQGQARVDPQKAQVVGTNQRTRDSMWNRSMWPKQSCLL